MVKRNTREKTNMITNKDYMIFVIVKCFNFLDDRGNNIHRPSVSDCLHSNSCYPKSGVSKMHIRKILTFFPLSKKPFFQYNSVKFPWKDTS